MDERDRLETEIAIEADQAERAGRKVASLDDISMRVHKDRIYIAIVGGAALFVAALLSLALVLKWGDDKEDDRQQAALEATTGQLQQAVADIETSRAEARVVACNADNDFAEKHNALVRQNQQTWHDILETPDISADTRAFAERKLAAYEANIVPLRKCDPASIEAYYSTNP